MKITIIHPSRGRAGLALEVVNRWISRAANVKDIEYILSIDDEPEQINSYFLAFGQQYVTFCINNNRSAIDAINNAAKIATGDLFIVVSDDFDCPGNWDTLLLDALKGKSDFVVKTADGCEKWIITLPIMDRVYYNRFGYVYMPYYRHMFCDTEMTHVADLLGRKITLDIEFKHLHHSKDYGIEKDEVSSRNDSTWAQGEKLYIERVKKNFDLQNTLPTRPPKAHRHWLSSRGVNI